MSGRPGPALTRRDLLAGATGTLLAGTGATLLAGCTSPAGQRQEGDGATGDRTPPGARWVSPSGDDDAPGTRERPWRSLSAALARLGPGDTLVLRGGTYDEDVAVDCRAGRADAPVRVRPASGERPLLTGLLRLRAPTRWDVRGLDVAWSTRASSTEHMVKIEDGAHWTYADAELRDARSYAALLVSGKPSRFRLSGLHVHDTRPSNGTNQDHLVYLNCGKGGGVVERCLLVGSPNGRALKIGPPEEGGPRVGNLLVRRNTMVDNRGPSNVQLAYEVSDVTVERNIMVGAGAGRASVTTFELDGKRNVVRQNVCWDSAGPVDDGGVRDGGGNAVLDPRLSGPSGPRPYEPREPRARHAGRWS